MWWFLTIIIGGVCLLQWQRCRLLQKHQQESSFLTSQQIHQIKNDLTAVHIAIEGLSLAGKDSLPVEQYNVLTSAAHYSHRLKRSVCELLELGAMTQGKPLTLRPTQIGMHELVLYKEFSRFAPSIKQSILSHYGTHASFKVDRAKLLQVFDSFTAACEEYGTAPEFTCTLEENQDYIDVKFCVCFKLTKENSEFSSSLEYLYVWKMAEVLGWEHTLEIAPEGTVKWELGVSKLQWQKQIEKILVVRHGATWQLSDATVCHLTGAMGAIVESVDGVENALNALQQNCFSTVVFDGSNELGQQLALAKILRHDLHIPARTVLISPEKAVSPQLASEFGIDSVMNPM